MVLVYCEFQPSAHRNKRPATLMFLDDPADKFPMPVCSVCAQVIRKQQPNAILRDRAEFEKERKEKKAAARKAASGAKPGDAPPAESGPDQTSSGS